MKNYDKYFFERKKMVDDQIIKRGIKNNKVIESMLRVPRHKFIPEDKREYSYKDIPVQIGYSQTISQPYIVALMVQLIDIEENKKILEIGTGSGYQTAILSEMGFQEIYTVEINNKLSHKAKRLLEQLGYKNVYFKICDGNLGWLNNSPFDAILVSAASKEVPKVLLDQLSEGGRLVIPVGEYEQNLISITKLKYKTTEEYITPVRFVPLLSGKH